MRQKINPEFIKGMEVWIVRNEQGRFTGWYGKRIGKKGSQNGSNAQFSIEIKGGNRKK